MKLEPAPYNKTPRENYDLADWPAPWHSEIERMLTLVAYLEDEVAFPVVRASYSHENLIIAPADRSWTLWISPSVPAGAPANAIYMLRCPLSKPWHHVSAYAANLEDVGRILTALINGKVELAVDYTLHSAHEPD